MSSIQCNSQLKRIKTYSALSDKNRVDAGTGVPESELERAAGQQVRRQTSESDRGVPHGAARRRRRVCLHRRAAFTVIIHYDSLLQVYANLMTARKIALIYERSRVKHMDVTHTTCGVRAVGQVQKRAMSSRRRLRPSDTFNCILRINSYDVPSRH